jgi:hypothetical protein
MKRKPKPAAKLATNHHNGSDLNNPSSLQVTASSLLCYKRAYTAVSSGEVSFLDSGASHHMFSDKAAFTDCREQKTLIELTDGNNLKSKGKGFVSINTKEGAVVKLKALHVPELAGILISFGRLFELGCNVVCTGRNSFDLVKNNAIILLAEVVGGTCNVHLEATSPGQSSTQQALVARKATPADLERIHRATGHPNSKALRKMFPKFCFGNLKCEACALSKSHRLPYPGSLPKATRPLEFVSMDLSGKISPLSFSGSQYYFKIKDHFTQFRHVYLLSSKSKTFHFFMKYYLEVTNHHARNIETILFDGGGEFNSKEFLAFLTSKGITVQVTAPYTPQQNTIAKRANRTTSEKARCMLKQAKLPSK